MTEYINKKQNSGDLALFEDLERRYGPGMAQDIMDQLKKAESLKDGKQGSIEPQYTAVTALISTSSIAAL